MQEKTALTSGINSGTIVLIAAAALLAILVLTDRNIPLLKTDRSALLILIVLGMAACTAGIGRVAESGVWTHPLALSAYLIGAIILVIGLGALFNRVIPPLDSFRQAFSLVSVLIAVKLVISNLHRFFL